MALYIVTSNLPFTHLPLYNSSLYLSFHSLLIPTFLLAFSTCSSTSSGKNCPISVSLFFNYNFYSLRYSTFV